MYKLLLILRYLRRKLAPMFAAVAVMLCTMMVIIVISVMGGFLDLLQESARRLTGDVVVTAVSLTGFPHYDDLIERLEARPEIGLATPVVRSFGLLNVMGQTRPVQIQGVRPDELDRIVDYRGSLYWTQDDLLADLDARYDEDDLADDNLRVMYEARRDRIETLDLQTAAVTFEPPVAWQGEAARAQPGMVIGIEVSPYQSRTESGGYLLANAALAEEATLMVFPLTSRGNLQKINPSYEQFVVVNEFKSGLYDIDANVVFVPFDVLQRMLDMHPLRVQEAGFDPITGESSGVWTERPARVTELVVKAAPGYGVAAAQAAAAEAVDEWATTHRAAPRPFVQTWEEVHATLLDAVRNETGLVTFLFAVISLVAVVMVATTFYMIVLEKTRDIGTLRAIGASRWGIMNIFLGYGFAIGVVGSLLGLALAVAIVTNLNEIQELLYQSIGWRMWDPRTYFFDRIPDRVYPGPAAWIVVGAIASSVVGALIPALLASRQDPVESLRYE